MEGMIRLSMESCSNVRDLGGYITESGKVTNFKAFLRADDQSQLTENDIQLLKNYGLQTIIDLRSNHEVKANKDTLQDDENIDYFHISFIDENIGDVTTKNINLEDMNLGHLYVHIVKSKEAVQKALKTIAYAKEGTILYHCSAGKDRTGVLSMLLLGICGVSKKDILANYQVSYTYIREKMEAQMKQFGVPKKFMISDPELIETAYDYIIDNYKTFKDYFIACGLTEEEIDKIVNRLL